MLVTKHGDLFYRHTYYTLLVGIVKVSLATSVQEQHITNYYRYLRHTRTILHRSGVNNGCRYFGNNALHFKTK